MGHNLCDCAGRSAQLDVGPPGPGITKASNGTARSEFWSFNLTPVANGPEHIRQRADPSFNMRDVVKGAKAILVVNLGGT